MARQTRRAGRNDGSNSGNRGQQGVDLRSDDPDLLVGLLVGRRSGAAEPSGSGTDADAGQAIDMWHWKRVRTEPWHQVDDQKIIPITDIANPTATEKADGGRGSDASTVGGVSDNVQTIGTVKVPKYVIPGRTGYYWIMQSEIDNGTAKLITAVDANGILTYVGGTIDPAAGGYEAGTGTKRFPSVYNKGALDGSRGDITSFAKHTGTGWVIEISRAMTTSDVLLDVQYDIAKTYKFGFAIFENSAIGHGIKPDLKLSFK